MTAGFRAIALAALMGVMSVPAVAGENWTLKGALSSISFGSVKKETVGETFRFSNLSGSVSEKGRVRVVIDLASVQTGVEIRDKRMRAHVFGDPDGKKRPKAILSADIDPATFTALPVGMLKPISLKIDLEFLGRRHPVEANLVVARISPERIMVLTDGMIWFSTKDLGIDEGISKLQELADLPSITRAFPVSARLVFQK